MLAHKSIMQLTNILSDFKLNINAYKTTEILWGLTTFRTETAHVYRMMKSHTYSNLLQNY